MAKFMLLLGGATAYAPLPGMTAAEVLEKYKEWMASLSQRGALLLTHKLADSEGKKLVSGGKGRVLDGPYVETKESIGGFVLIEAADYDQALVLARDCPIVKYQAGFVEVRRVEF